MDASMYEFCGSSSTLLDERPHRMALDFAASPRKCFYPVSTASTHVTSPDLESFLLYASAGPTDADWAENTTSTPTQILFPNSVTAEQEAYARGFVDALEELHRRQGVPATAGPAQSVVWSQSSSSCSTDHTASCWTTDVSYQLTASSTPGHSSSVSSPGSSVGGPGRRAASRVVDDGPDGAQTVPRLSCLTPPSSPDVDAVELARIDRKRERNRLAAQKCRSRKLEQIAVLESRCAVLRSENDALSRTAGQMADEVSRLRQTLAEHTAGTKCVMNNSYTTSNPSSALKSDPLSL